MERRIVCKLAKCFISFFSRNLTEAEWNGIFNHLKKNCQPKIVCLEKLLISFSSEGEASNQDGRLEGHVLTTSYENIRITSNSWTTIEKNKKKKQKLPKITLHPKSKKPQQDGRRSTIMMKSNSIPAGWVTSWKTIILQKFSHWNEVLSTPIRIPSLGGWQKEEPQRIWLWRSPRFDHRYFRIGKKTDTPFFRFMH